VSTEALKLRHEVIEGDCLSILPGIPDGSVDAVITDPPYMGVVGNAWDNAWADDDAFLSWCGSWLRECARVLRPNGCVWVFCYPRMASRMEAEVGQHFRVLSSVVWDKSTARDGAQWKQDRSSLRTWFPASERIIYAEHKPNGPGGPISPQAVRHQHYAGMAGHWFGASQWELPTAANYEWLRGKLNGVLRRDYEELRRDYEELRRPFAIGPSDQFTDVWRFDPEPPGRGGSRHPCAKPLHMMEHIIRTTTRPGALVLDPFAGSGTTGAAAVALGRAFVGIEQDERWAALAWVRVLNALAQMVLL
jgi:adenine-specific DNA-methyltransferase